MSATDGSTAAVQQDQGTPSMVTTVRAVTAVVALLALLVCSTRIYLRKFVTRSFGLDDCLVIIALILVLGFAALSITVTFYGIGYHQDAIPPEQLPTMQYVVYISLCTYLFVASSVKISLTVFIMRVFPTKIIRRIGWCIIGFLIVLTISGEFPLILQCQPVRAAYDKTLVHFKCFSKNALFAIEMYQGVLMFAIDIVIIVLPIPTIWNLQMPIQRRVSIIGLFALGLVACAACLARLPTLVYQKDVTDFTYSGATPLIWMNVEFCLGLVAGSAPSLRTLFKFIPGLYSQKSYGKSNEWRGGTHDQGAYQLGAQGNRRHKVLGSRAANPEPLGSIASGSQERIFPGPKPDRM